MPGAVALFTLAFQRAKQGNSTYTAFWHKKKKSSSIDAKINKGGATFQASSNGESDFENSELLWLFNIYLD